MDKEVNTELKGYLSEIAGMKEELKGLPGLYNEMKIKTDEIVGNIAELRQSVELIGKKSAVGPVDVNNAAEVKALMDYAKKGVAQELNGPSGGYIVTPTLASRIFELQTDMDDMRKYASVINVGTNVLQVPRESSEATAEWVGENQQRNDTDNAKLGLANIGIYTVQATVPISRDLIQDAGVVNPEQYFLQKISKALSKEENKQFVIGNGHLKPEGLFKCTEISSKEASVAGGASFTADDLIDLWAETTLATDKNARYYMNKKMQAIARKFKDDNKQYLWTPSLVAGQPSMFNGFEVATLVNAPDIAAGVSSIAFGDMGNTYVIADRTDVELLRDETSKKRYNEIEFTVNKRVGGGVVQPDSMVFLKGKSA